MSLKLTLNQPVQLALTRPDPKQYQNHGRPDSFMYSVVVLADGTEEKVFLSAECSQTIQELQIQPRQPFVLCRRKTPQGTEYFEVQTPAKSQLSKTLPPTSIPTPAPKPMNSAATSITSQTRASSLMAAALITAIDAATLAREYAASKGVALEFKTEDYRCIAATLYIQASKDPLFAERGEAA